MGRILINCDLGENEPRELTEAILPLVDAANIGCGVHAGSLGMTEATLLLAAQADCLIGAHPGIAADGGRGSVVPSLSEFESLLEEQVGTFLQVAKTHAIDVHYVKLHGSLYHLVESDLAYAEVYLAQINALGIAAICTLAGGQVAALAKAVGIRAYPEVFADRAYTSQGRLLNRREVGAVLDESVALQRLSQWIQDGEMPTYDGQTVLLTGETVCVHADSPDSLPMIEKIRALFG